MRPARTVKFRLANFLAWGTGELEAAQQACEQARELFARAGEDHGRHCWPRARSDGSRACAATSRGWRADAERVVARRPRRSGIGSSRCRGWPRSATARISAAHSPKARRRCGERRRSPREDEKAYRLTVVLGVLAAGIARPGPERRAGALLERGEVAEPGVPGQHPGRARGARAVDRRGLPERGRRGAARPPHGSRAAPRRRAFGLVFGGLSALEAGDVVEAERLLGRAHGRWSASREWATSSSALASGRGGPGLARRPGRPSASATLAGPRPPCCGRRARKWAAFVLFDLAEAAADAGDADAAAAAAADLDDVARVRRPADVPRPRRDRVGLGEPRRRPAGATPSRRPREAAIGLLCRTGWRAHAGPRSLRARPVAGRRRPRRGGGSVRAGGGATRTSAAAAGAGTGRSRRCAGSGASAAAPRRPRSAPARSTRREREVARLAASGMSAKEIAAALFVGERTVESHLASTYAKLGVSPSSNWSGARPSSGSPDEHGIQYRIRVGTEERDPPACLRCSR